MPQKTKNIKAKKTAVTWDKPLKRAKANEKAKSIKLKKVVVKRIRDLNVRKELHDKKSFRVAIYGSARTKMDDPIYRQVFDLAYRIGQKGYDVVTGGGPGLMEAANYGHDAGDKDNKAESIGLRIELSFEQNVNPYVEVNKEFRRFAERLETFTHLSDVFVITPGGIGTMLEFFYTWQLVQVKKMSFKPIIMIGEMWRQLIYWIIDYALRDGLLNAEDFQDIYLVKDNEEAMKLINEFHEQKKVTGNCFPLKAHFQNIRIIGGKNDKK
jgi:uncharacterized protein (TIGR00730 family)